MDNWKVSTRSGKPCLFLNGKPHCTVVKGSIRMLGSSTVPVRVLHDFCLAARSYCHKESKQRKAGEKAEIYRRHQQGVSVKSLADELGLSTAKVKQMVESAAWHEKCLLEDVQRKARELAVEAWRATVDVSSVPDRPLDELEVSWAVYERLFFAGIRTLKDLMHYRANDLLRVGGVRRSTLKRLEEVLSPLGLALPDPELDSTPFLDEARVACGAPPELLQNAS